MVEARDQVARGTHTPESTSATLGEAVELVAAAGRGGTFGARNPGQYRQHRGHLLELIPAETRLAKLTTARVEQLRDDLLKRHNRPMARKVLGSFKAVLKDARRRGLVAQNVAAETTIGGQWAAQAAA